MMEPIAGEDGSSAMRAWGATIRRYRQWKQWSRRELASRAGISSVFLGEIERGQKDPSSHSLARIAGALDVPLGELYLRVAARLEMEGGSGAGGQAALPLEVREEEGQYPVGVPLAQDETAFDLYRVVRMLRSDQQVSLLLLARSLVPVRR